MMLCEIFDIFLFLELFFFRIKKKMLKNTHYHKEVTHKSMQKILLEKNIIKKYRIEIFNNKNFCRY